MPARVGPGYQLRASTSGVVRLEAANRTLELLCMWIGGETKMRSQYGYEKRSGT